MLILALTGLGGCSMQRSDSGQAGFYTDHALAGSSWDLRSGQQLSQEALAGRLGDTAYLLVGEVHDNPDHHRIQLELLRLWMERDVRPALVFEQFDRSQQSQIDKYLYDLNRLEEETEFTARGWDWDAYLPLLKAARSERLSVYGGNLSREELRATRQEAPSDELNRLLEPCLLPAAMESLKTDIADAHCGMLDAATIDKMFAAQRLRDASLAATMLEASAPAMLIAGNGHVRLDYGVGQVLSLNQDQKLLSVGLVEVSPDYQTPEDYGYLFVDGVAVFDIAIFTPRVRDEDPCETFREQLKMIEHGKKP
jgi:uncharacterized iron-regulated protein